MQDRSSGKTSLLVEICKQLKPDNGIYLAYNKSVAVESQGKFPKEVNCLTTHSLAYQNTIKNYGLKVGSFFWKSIKDRVTYEDKLIILDVMKDWTSSKFDKFDKYQENKNKETHNIQAKHFSIAKKYFNKMVKGEIPITHDGYLKFYHLLLAHNQIKHTKFDIVLLDEAGDLIPVTFEIFNLLESKRKILVGDKNKIFILLIIQ